jgi:hypothetical protein
MNIISWSFSQNGIIRKKEISKNFQFEQLTFWTNFNLRASENRIAEDVFSFSDYLNGFMGYSYSYYWCHLFSSAVGFYLHRLNFFSFLLIVHITKVLLLLSSLSLLIFLYCRHITIKKLFVSILNKLSFVF